MEILTTDDGLTRVLTHDYAFTYASFVGELYVLVQETMTWRGAERRCDSAVFLAWQNKLVGYLDWARRSYMDVRCGVQDRHFFLPGYGANQADHSSAFERDLAVTVLELQHITDHYRKYGEPQMKSSAVKAKAAANATPPAVELPKLTWPEKEKVTMKWLWEHMPASAWGWLGTAVAGALAAGLWIGAWTPFQTLITSWVRPPTIVYAPPPPPGKLSPEKQAMVDKIKEELKPRIADAAAAPASGAHSTK